MYKNFLRKTAIGIFAIALLAGCTPKSVKTDEEPVAAEEQTGPLKETPAEEVTQPPMEPVKEEALQESSSAKQVEAASESAVKIELKTIYFDYDKYAIRSSERVKIESNADMLKSHPNVSVVIEGHCDERGETEYNLALGDKRAKSIENYMMTLGVKGSQISTVSYGEERPADSGHDEAAWANNRRAEFKVSQ